MRKKVIKDFNFKHSYNNTSLRKVLSSYVLRQEGYRKGWANPLAKKVDRQNSNWTKTTEGYDSDSIVIIDDSRQEIAQVGERGLITTSLIFEELINCNRGSLSYEQDRNKFFTKDKTSNSRELHGDYQIMLLDLLWHMSEENLDAVEIQKNPEKGYCEGFMSKRYGKMFKKDMNKATKEVEGILNLFMLK